MDKVLTKILEDVANKHSSDIQEVERVLNLPYKMMRERIQGLELHDKSYSDISSLKTNFNMPLLFKMYVNEFKINTINKKLEKNDTTEEN